LNLGDKERVSDEKGGKRMGLGWSICTRSKGRVPFEKDSKKEEIWCTRMYISLNREE